MSSSRPSFVCDMCLAECVGIHEHSQDEISRMLRDFMLHVHLTETIEVLTDYLEQLNLNSEQIALVKKVYNFTVDLNNLPEVATMEMTDRSIESFDQSHVTVRSDSCNDSWCKDDDYVQERENTGVFKDTTNTVRVEEFKEYGDKSVETEYDKENYNSMVVKKIKQNSDETMMNVKRKCSIKCVRCQLQKKPCDYQYPCNRCLNARKNDMSCYYEY